MDVAKKALSLIVFTPYNFTIRFEFRHLKSSDPQVLKFRKRMQVLVARNKN